MLVLRVTLVFRVTVRPLRVTLTLRLMDVVRLMFTFRLPNGYARRIPGR